MIITGSSGRRTTVLLIIMSTVVMLLSTSLSSSFWSSRRHNYHYYRIHQQLLSKSSSLRQHDDVPTMYRRGESVCTRRYSCFAANWSKVMTTKKLTATTKSSPPVTTTINRWTRLQVQQQQQHFGVPSRMMMSNARNNDKSNSNKSKNDVEVSPLQQLKSIASTSFQTLVVPGESGNRWYIGTEHETKKSRFIGYAAHVSTWNEAQNVIESVKKEHSKARHWCYAYRGSINSDEERSSDDGEPAGTGGQPIVSAIRSEYLVNVVCIVVRYYGGIQLGTGGLIRAYGLAARTVLRESPKQMIVPTQSTTVTLNPEYIGILYDCISKSNGKCVSQNDESYDNDGNLSLTVSCNVNGYDDFQRTLYDLTRGNVVFS